MVSLCNTSLQFVYYYLLLTGVVKEEAISCYQSMSQIGMRPTSNTFIIMSTMPSESPPEHVDVINADHNGIIH